MPNTKTVKPTVTAAPNNTKEPELALAYVCSCGKQFAEEKLRDFTTHLLTMGRKEAGKHESRGLIDLVNNIVRRKPRKDRTIEDVAQYRIEDAAKAKAAKAQNTQAKPPANKDENPKNESPKNNGEGGGRKFSPGQFTPNFKLASQAQFVPRVMTVDLTPEMRAGYDAARELWGWDIPFGEHLNIINKQFFLDRGIKLGGYVIIESEEEHAARLQAEEQKDGDGDIDIMTEEEETDANA